MFCVKEFVVGENAGVCSGFVVVAIVAINIAAMNAGKKLSGNKNGRQTAVTYNLPKQNLIKEIAKEPIVNGNLHFPLWIKVHISTLLRTSSLRR